MGDFLYEFEWDPAKALTNFKKHGVHFEQATHVFRDALALTIPDEEHRYERPVLVIYNNGRSQPCQEPCT